MIESGTFKKALLYLAAALSITACSTGKADGTEPGNTAVEESAADTASDILTKEKGSVQDKASDDGTGTGGTGDISAAEGDIVSPDTAFSAEIFAMDTVMTLTAYGPEAEEALDEAAKEILRLDALFSISSESGDIYKLNQNGKYALSEETLFLLKRSLDFSGLTGGVFDCTIEPVMEAWGFTDQDYRVPEEDELNKLITNVDYTLVDIDGSTAALPEDVRVDLGGIAKGYASSHVMDVFKEHGVTSGIISLGGNVQALNVKPDGSLWRVGIQDPWDLNELCAILEIEDKAVITSGPYQRYFEQDGVNYHHIIDPETGYPAESGLMSVTIVSDDGTLADALSTSLFIVGADEALNFWAEHRDEFDAVLITSEDDIYVTEGLAECFTLKKGRNVKVVL